MQELLELAETAPIVIHISRGGARMELVESQLAPPAAAPEPVEPAQPKKPRRLRKPRVVAKVKPGPKPKRPLGGRGHQDPKVVARIDKMLAAGISPVKIATRLGIGTQTVYNRRYYLKNSTKGASSRPAAIPRQMKAAPSRQRGRKPSPEKQEALEMFAAGKRPSDIAVDLKVPYGTVWNWLRRVKATAAKKKAGPDPSPADERGRPSPGVTSNGKAPARPAEAPAPRQRTTSAPGGGKPVSDETPAGVTVAPARRLSKATERTHAIAERIEGAAADGQDPDIAALTSCPHCGEGLVASRYGGLRCRNAGCDLVGEMLSGTRVARDDCNCAVCIHARAMVEADIESSDGTAAETQNA